MENPMISASVFAVMAVLMQGAATNTSWYVHPDHAPKSDQAKVPRWSMIFVRHHDLMKWGGAVLSWGCFAIAQAIKPHSPTYYHAALAGAFIGGILFSLSLNWRIYAIVEGGRSPDDRP